MLKPKITIGIDPDSKAHGVAIYRDGILSDLHEWDLPKIVEFISNEDKGSMLFSIENVTSKKCVYSQNSSKKSRPQGEIGRRLGMCQQSQVELERFLRCLEVPYILHMPQSGNWSNTSLKGVFSKATGWDKQSNKETRSAAFFGFLAINR